jgi:hypothetical protein
LLTPLLVILIRICLLIRYGTKETITESPTQTDRLKNRNLLWVCCRGKKPVHVSWACVHWAGTSGALGIPLLLVACCEPNTNIMRNSRDI